MFASLLRSSGRSLSQDRPLGRPCLRVAVFLLLVGLAPALFADGSNASNTVVRFQIQRGTNALGTMDVELFDQEKPATVNNFLLYLRSGAYSNDFFHRCVPGFVVQGGGFSVTNPLAQSSFSNYLTVTNYGNLTNEFLVGPPRSNTFGTIAMAKLGGDPNSATSQWFFNLAANTNLDSQNGGFTVFGHVLAPTNSTDGTNVLNFFNTLSTSAGIVDVSQSTLLGSNYAVFSSLPVTYTNTTARVPTYQELYYLNISLLNRTNQPGQFPPSIALLSPAPNSRFTNQTVTISGTATDDVEVARVVYRVQGGPLQIVAGTTNWQVNLAPPAGLSTVAVQSIDWDGNFSSNAPSVTFLYVARFPLNLQIVGSGTVTGATNGQFLEAGSFYTLNAVPNAGNLFDSWTGSVSSASSSLTFQVPPTATNFNLTAKFKPNPIPLLAGTYQGLFMGTNTPAPENAGAMSMVLTTSGAFTGGILNEGVSYFYSGAFDSNGTATIQGVMGGTSRSFSLQLNLLDTNGVITGSIVGGSVVVQLERVASALPASNSPPAGSYTFVLPVNRTNVPSQLVPGGDGYGTATLAASGALSLSGTLGDGTAFTGSASLTRSGHWPLYVSLFGGRGVLLGWLSYETNQPSNLDGNLQWIKSPATTDTTYRSGFSNQVAFAASAYVPPATGTRVLDWVYGLSQIAGTDLQLNITNTAKLSTSNTLSIIDSNTHSVKLTLTVASGLVSGSFVHPWAGTTNALHGAILKRSQSIRGQFTAGQQTGTLDVNVTPFLVTQSVVNVTLPGLLPLLGEGGLLRFQNDGVVVFTNSVTLPYDTFLDGNGHDVVLSGGGASRIFQIPTNVNFTASGVTFADGRFVGTNGTSATHPQPGGDGCGAGILNLGGILSLTNCVLTNFFVQGGNAGVGPATNNLAPGGRGLGAAICSLGGSVTLSNCLFADNLAVGGQGNADQSATSVWTSRGAALGGAVFSDGAHCEIQGTTFLRNQTRGGDARLLTAADFAQAGDGAGGALAIANARLHLASSQCLSNTAAGPGTTTNSIGGGSGHGGALFVETNATALVELTTFAENLALGGTSELAANVAKGRGGAVFNAGALQLQSCTLEQNTAQGGFGNPAGPALGGGVASAGSLVVNACTLDKNLAQGGSGAAITTNGVSAHGAAGSGGAIYALGGSLAVTNSTWAFNQAIGGFGAPAGITNAGTGGDGSGGALTVVSNTVTLADLTFAFNQAQPGNAGATNSGAASGGGLANSNATLTLFGSIVASNTPANFLGPVIDSGYNLSSDASFSFPGAGSVTNTDPLLGPLTTNGGPTLTMTLLTGSPARDALPTNNVPPVDQRGFSRPQGLAADIGAVEVQLTLPLFVVSPQSANRRAQTSVTFSASAVGPAPISYFWLKDGALVTGQTSTTLSFPNLQASDSGNYAAVATNSFGSVTSAVATLTVDATPLILNPNLPTNVLVAPNLSASFVVVVDGPVLSYLWLHNGQPVPGANTSLLYLNNAGPGAQGTYQAIVTNFAGAVTSRVATLTFTSAGLGLNPPSSLTVAPGQPASLASSAVGYPPFSYQWFFAPAPQAYATNALPLPNATNAVLFFPSADFTNAGLYYVVVTNVYGSLTSPPVTLTVIPQPVLSVALTSTNLLISAQGTNGTSARLLCATNLSPSAIWTPVDTNTIPPSGTVTFTRPIPTNGSVYYRTASP